MNDKYNTYHLLYINADAAINQAKSGFYFVHFHYLSIMKIVYLQIN